MQKTLLVKLVEEYYGAGKSERVYGRLVKLSIERINLPRKEDYMAKWMMEG